MWPQALPDNTSHATPDNGSVPNPNGCWDWIGWYGGNFDQVGGAQMAAIVSMVNQITSGFSAAPPGIPAGLTAGAVTNTTVALSWTAVAGASSYTVFRNAVPVGTSTTNGFTDTGLTVGTITSTSVALSWGLVSGAIRYAIYRNGGDLPIGTSTATSYADTGPLQ